jgi:hypothetical protein
MYPAPNQKQGILSDESHSMRKYLNLRKRKEYQKNIDGIKRCLVKRSLNDCPNIPYGTMQ